MFSSKIETITPEIAKEYLKYNTFNRTPSSRSVDVLADQMSRGQWQMNGQAIIFADNGKLLDGQHRLLAIIKSGVAIETVVTRGIKEESFVSLDTGHSRSAGDIFTIAGVKNSKAIAAGLGKLAMMEKGRNVFVGSSLYRSNKITPYDLLIEYQRRPEYYQELYRVSIKFYEAGRIMRHSEIYAIMAYLINIRHHSQAHVEAFFSSLCIGTYNDCSAINLYRNMLIRDKTALQKMIAPVRNNLLAKTWNAYITHKSPKCLKWQEKEGNIDFL